MLERLLINKSHDIGKIAEALLFYDQVHIIANENTFNALFSRVTKDLLISFFDEHKDKIIIDYYESDLACYYCEDSLPIYIQIKNEQQIDKSPYLEYLSRNEKQLYSLIHIKQTSDTDLEDILQLIFRSTYFSDYCFNYMQYQGLKLNHDHFHCELMELNHDDHRYRVDTNIEDSNPLKHALYAYIYMILDIIRSSKYKSDIMNMPFNADTIQQITNSLLPKLNKMGDINLFQEVTIRNGKTISSVINSGERSFKDFIKLYEKSRQFKKWLINKDSNADLIEEYNKEIYTNTWAEKLPIKATRWAIFTGTGLLIDCLGAGGIGTISGLSLSFLDAFILDNLIKGWKPNQFINEELKKFL